MTYTYTLPQVVTDKNKIQAGAINFMIELHLLEGNKDLDVSSASALNIVIQKPDDSVLTYPAILRTDGKDGLIYHLTILGDLDIEGIYYAQAYIDIPSFKGYSTPVKFTVYENIPIDEVQLTGQL